MVTRKITVSWRQEKLREMTTRKITERWRHSKITERWRQEKNGKMAMNILCESQIDVYVYMFIKKKYIK